TVRTVRQAMDPAKTRGVRPALLRVADGVDAVADRVEHRVVALTENHLLRILEEVAHRDAEALHDLGYVGLHADASLRARHDFADDLARTERTGCRSHDAFPRAGLRGPRDHKHSRKKGQAPILKVGVPPRAEAKRAEVLAMMRR